MSNTRATSSSSRKIKKSSSSSIKYRQPSSSVPRSSNRVFSEEDELKILEAVLQREEDNPVPAKVAVIIFNDIQDKINAKISITQLGDKLRKLRDRYCKETDGELEPHKKKLSILCNKIWGFKKNSIEQKILKDVDMRNLKEEDLIKRYPYLMEEVSKGLPAFASKGNLRYLDMSVLQGLNDRWKKQHVQELQISVKRMEIMEECLKLVIGAQSSYEAKDVDVDDEQTVAEDDEQKMAEDDSDDEQMEDDNEDENERFADDEQVEDENELVEEVDDKDIEEVEVEADE